MREIIKDILGSEVPVAVYVAPNGARAASAGTYILYAAHVAAMAPATNLGAATPVSIGMPAPGGPKSRGRRTRPDDRNRARTATDDEEAGQRRGGLHPRPRPDSRPQRESGRSGRCARRSASPPRRPSAQRVIDFVARDLDELLAKSDGRKVTVRGQAIRAGVAGAVVETILPDWRSKLLATITNPSFALILMMLGIYGIWFEFSNPGFVFPGVIGAICLLLAMFAFQMLPVNYVGLALIVLGLAFMVAEVFFPSFGSLGIGGMIAFVVGAICSWTPRCPARDPDPADRRARPGERDLHDPRRRHGGQGGAGPWSPGARSSSARAGR